MKQLLAITLSGVMALSPLSLDGDSLVNNSNVIVTKDIGTTEKTSELSITSNTAVCKSSCRKGAEPIQTITAVQTLEKKDGAGRFCTVQNASWSKTVNAEILSMRNSANQLSAGNYRLKTVFTVNYKNGQSETITVYSIEKTVT